MIRDDSDDDYDQNQDNEDYHMDNNNQSHHNDGTSNNYGQSQSQSQSMSAYKAQNKLKKRDQEITLRDLRNAQMKRDQLEKICTEPFFEKFISRKVVPDPDDDRYEIEYPGLFCRIYIGDRKTSSGKTEPIYRICEMIGIQDYPRSYQLTDKRTTINIGILITHGRSKRVFKVIQTSNSPFTEKEFAQWKATMNVKYRSEKRFQFVYDIMAITE